MKYYITLLNIYLLHMSCYIIMFSAYMDGEVEVLWGLITLKCTNRPKLLKKELAQTPKVNPNYVAQSSMQISILASIELP